MQLSM